MLRERLAGYVRYFEALALQPPNRWERFYQTQREEGRFGLRFQLAFACYALAALSLHPDAEPEEQQRCHAAMSALIERMLQRRVWAYWAMEAERRGITPDPLEKGNAQYSGHLAMMIGALVATHSDYRYDEDFKLHWSTHERFAYSYTAVVDTLARQMRSTPHAGVESESGRVCTPDMGAVMWAMLLHDSAHATDYARLNRTWLRFVRERLTLRGPRLAGRGVLSALYLTRSRLVVPAGLRLFDAWTLAFLALLEPELTAQLQPRFLAAVRRGSLPESAEPAELANNEVAWLPSASFWKSREIADLATTTGYAYLLAVHLGNDDLAAALLAYADAHFKPVEEEGHRSYASGIAPPYTTALFALGEAGGLRPLYENLRAQSKEPYESQQHDDLSADEPPEQEPDITPVL